MELELSTVCHNCPRFMPLADHLNGTVRDWAVLTPLQAIKDVPQDLKPLAHAFHGFLKQQHMFEELFEKEPTVEITGDTLVTSLCYGKFAGLKKVCEGLTLDELRCFKSLVPGYWYPLVKEFLVHYRITYGMLELSEDENKDSW